MRWASLCLLAWGCGQSALVAQTDQWVVVGGGDASCLSQTRLEDRGTIVRYDQTFQGVPLTSTSGYHRFTVEGPGELWMKSRDFEPALALPGAALQRETRPDIGGFYVHTAIADGRFSVVATSTANLTGCPAALSEGAYTITLQ